MNTSFVSGNAKWTGVRVLDVLRACGADVDAIALGKQSTGGMKIVNFIAEDTDETGVQYGGILPIEKVTHTCVNVRAQQLLEIVVSSRKRLPGDEAAQLGVVYIRTYMH